MITSRSRGRSRRSISARRNTCSTRRSRPARPAIRCSMPPRSARPMWSPTISPSAVREKQQRDEAEFDKLVAKGTPVARMNTGIDGGMNQVFAAQVPGGSTGLSEGAKATRCSSGMSKAPGTIPGYVNPPKPNLEAIAAAPQEEPVVAVSRTRDQHPRRLGRQIRRLLLQSRPQDGPGHRRHDGDHASAPQATASVAPAPRSAEHGLQAEGRSDAGFVPGHDKSEGRPGGCRKARRAGETRRDQGSPQRVPR